MTQKKRNIVQVLFLLVFVFLTVTDRMQPWMFITFLSILLAMFWGRFYCGFVCPIFTVSAGTEKLGKSLVKKRKQVPLPARSPVTRVVILALFLAGIIATLSLGLKIPLFLVLIVIAAVLAIFYVPAFWHRYLCPLGLLLSLTSRFTRVFFVVERGKCSGCGLCERRCPGEAIYEEQEGGIRAIEPRNCLQCFICRDICPQKAISLVTSRRMQPPAPESGVSKN